MADGIVNLWNLGYVEPHLVFDVKILLQLGPPLVD